MMFGKNKAMTMADTTMGGAVLLASTLKSSGMISEGIYAVLPEIDFGSAPVTDMEIIFTCK